MIRPPSLFLVVLVRRRLTVAWTAMPRRDESAAYAANWRTVVAADALIGGATSVAGVVLALVLTIVGGVLLIAVGAWYLSLVGLRARRWARLRRDAGL
jgi:hypothetical protein